MTRQDKLRQIGQCRPSLFAPAKSKNQMSHFIIPVPHDIYAKKHAAKVLKGFAQNWEVQNANAGGNERIFANDAVSMASIKSYIYESMLPPFELKKDGSRAETDFILERKNLLFTKKELHPKWVLRTHYFDHKEKQHLQSGSVAIDLDGIDLWVCNEHIAFFVLKTKLDADDAATVNDVSVSYNRSLRDFRSIYVDEGEHTLSLYPNSEASKGVPLVEWLLSLVSIKENEKSVNLLNVPFDEYESQKYYPIYNTSYYAKMITAMHIDEMAFEGERIEEAYTQELLYNKINGTSVLEEVPYHLASSGEFYPSEMWENNEEYINSQVDGGGINIWKYWSGIAMHDSMAYFSIGSGGSGIVNHARHSYYFIYMLNLYVNYKMRFFEYNLIDDEFVSIDSIRPMYKELQRLRNKYMSVEIASRFQPNIVHGAISQAMGTDDIYGEIKENIDTTLEITEKNIELISTVVIFALSGAGAWVNQEQLLAWFESHPLTATAAALVGAVIAAALIMNISIIIMNSKKLFRQGRRWLRRFGI